MEYVDGKPQRFDDGIQDARHERIHEKHLQDERRSADKGNVEHDELFCLSFSASTHSLLRHQKSRHKREDERCRCDENRHGNGFDEEGQRLFHE